MEKLTLLLVTEHSTVIIDYQSKEELDTHLKWTSKKQKHLHL